jgi:hypothetical protein
MNTTGTRTPAVVRPSRLVAVVIGPLTKVLNPVMLKLAGRRHVMMVRAAFGPVERAMFRMLGIRQYLLLRRAGS